MTKQDKIWEGVEAQIRLGLIEKQTSHAITDAVYSYLHTQGIVLQDGIKGIITSRRKRPDMVISDD